MSRRFRVGLRADPLAVRQAVPAIARWLVGQGVSMESAGNVEIVLTEATNNVIEHACAASPGADLSITCAITAGCLSVRVRDPGVALPGHMPPAVPVADLACPVQDLPEGGFGWLLIAELAETVRYRRRGGYNLLDLSFRLRRA
ncbi:ATP-binding protein [Pukyongiella litopenaei]|uniref:ATP-binding protein n=1 Tax=Pukyongiella litopenaei TaxID=2605946 RepID=UPI001B80D97C|nr:ATP-binding protein [Pukyongiella litopenaei]